jgi:hypothetical protein
MILTFALATGLAVGCSDDADSGGGDEDLVGADAGADVGLDAVGADTEPEQKLDVGEDDEQDADTAPEPDTPNWGLEDVEGPEEDAGLADLELTNLAPSRGPVAGGTQFVIEGAGFTSETTVYFGRRQTEVQMVDGRLVGRTPEGAGPGTVTVKALDPQTGEASLNDGFTYVTSLKVDSVTPSRVPTDGGIEVTIDGAGFGQETRASFDGETALRHDVVDSETLRVVTPTNDAGPATLRLTGREESTSVEGAVTYFTPLEVDSVTPAAGPTAGGTRVTIRGQGFESGMTVMFGGETATIESVASDGTEATVTIPAHAAGLVDMSVETPSGDATLRQDAFYYRSQSDEFRVAAVEPAVGPASGGEEVRVIGAGLNASGVSLEFGGNVASIVRSGTGYVVVDLPAHGPGVVDVVAADGSGATSRLDGGFEYVSDLEVTNVSPAEGDAAGGTSVTIEGSGFSGVNNVSFGNVRAQFSVASDSEITATTPSHAPGTFDVQVDRGEMSATAENAFTFVEDLEVFGLSPVRGSSGGGTYVEIRGRGFTGDMGVTFGSNSGSEIELLDSQTVAVRTPKHQPGAVDVTVRRENERAIAPIRYTYFNPSNRSGGAWGGPIEGSVNVTVYSSQGQPIPGAFVMLSTNPETTYKGTAGPNGFVTLSGPDIYGAQTITATAAGYSTTSVQKVDAENVTVILTPSASGNGSPPPGPPTATFEGRLTGLDKVAEPSKSEYRMGIVLATKPHPWARTPEPGGNHIVERGNGDYELITQIGDLALVAFGGLYDSETDEFTPVSMGLKRYQSAAGNKTYQRDIDLDIPLDEDLTFKLSNPPQSEGGPDINRVTPYYDFGFEGVINATTIAEGDSTVLTAEGVAALNGKLSDVSYMAIGGSYTQETEGQLPPPQSVSVKRDITSTDQVVGMPNLIGVPFVTTPDSGEKPYNNIISLGLNSANRPDLFYARILTPMGSPVWDAFIPGSSSRVQLPEFPDFSHLPPSQRPEPYASGDYLLYVVGIDHPTLDYNSFSYSDLSREKWRAFSQYSQWIQF